MESDALVHLPEGDADLDIPGDPRNYERALRQCQHRYRAMLGYVGQDDINHALTEAARDLDSGQFFLTRVGRMAETDPGLVMALFVMRVRWIEEYGAIGSEEKLLIDQMLIALYHQIRLTEFLGNVEARLEAAYFGDNPLRAVGWQGDEVKLDTFRHIKEVRTELLPAIAQCQKMLTHSLRELRRSRVTRLTIQHVAQLNIAQQQVVAPVPTPGESRSLCPPNAEKT